MSNFFSPLFIPLFFEEKKFLYFLTDFCRSAVRSHPRHHPWQCWCLAPPSSVQISALRGVPGRRRPDSDLHDEGEEGNLDCCLGKSSRWRATPGNRGGGWLQMLKTPTSDGWCPLPPLPSPNETHVDWQTHKPARLGHVGWDGMGYTPTSQMIQNNFRTQWGNTSVPHKLRKISNEDNFLTWLFVQ